MRLKNQTQKLALGSAGSMGTSLLRSGYAKAQREDGLPAHMPARA